MNKKYLGLIGALMLVMGLHSAENQTIEQLRARRTELERSYAGSISALLGVISAASLGTAGYGIASSLGIFSNMPNKVPFNEKGRPSGFPADMPRPSFWQTLKETYTGVIPFYFGTKASASREFTWADYHIKRLPVSDQSTLALGFTAPILTPIGILTALLSKYLYNKAASYKKEIAEINEKIEALSQQ